MSRWAVWQSVLLLSAAALLLARAAHAGPWLAPDDPGLRADVELLSDSGVLDMPINTWPLSWRDLRRQLDAVKPGTLSTAEAAAYMRLEQAMRRALAPVGAGASVTAANRARRLHFGMDRPNYGSGGEVMAEATGPHVFAHLDASWVSDPDKGHHARLDGSYLGGQLGNWALTAGKQSRWWGPGWSDSLILSNNARPFPALALQRVSTAAFKSAWLHWIGPWQFRTFIGQLEHDRVVSDTKIFGMRVDFRPLPWLELGFSRTALWAGQGRPGGGKAFWEMLSGNSNAGSGGITYATNPADQLGGYDFRVNLPWRLALYGQLIGEDEAGHLPSKFLAQAGLSGWFPVGNEGSSMRWYLEYADTATDGFKGAPFYNFAYNHSVYKSGYRYYGRSIGHTIDSDSRLYTVGAILHDSRNWTYQFVVNAGQLNRDRRGQNPMAPNGADIVEADFDMGIPFRRTQRIDLGVGGLHYKDLGDSHVTTDGYIYAKWTYHFGSSAWQPLGSVWKGAAQHQTHVTSARSPNDSDGDGVPNDIDRCPYTPPGAKVNAQGCSDDSDMDGVPDWRDSCLGTRPGAKVDSHGCSAAQRAKKAKNTVSPQAAE